jgi:hypothetical protein
VDESDDFHGATLHAAQPPPPEVAFDLLVRGELPGIRLGETTRDALEHVDVVEHVRERAAVGKSLEQLPDGLLRIHAKHANPCEDGGQSDQEDGHMRTVTKARGEALTCASA